MGANAVEESHALMRNIVHLSYRPASAKTGGAGQILRQWRALRWQLRLVWLLKGWRNIVRPIHEKSSDFGEETGTQAG
jgi:hypothetical protein